MMKSKTQVSTKILQAMYKLQGAETKLYREDFLSAINLIEEAKRLILSANEEKTRP